MVIMASYRRLLPFINSTNMLCVRNCSTNVENIIPNKMLKKLQKSVLPPKPKKPTTAFFEYLYTVRHKLKEQNPEVKPAQIVKLASANWSQLDAAKRNEFQKIYDENHKNYLKELDNYKNSITPEQMDLVKQKQEEYVLNMKKLELKQKARALGKPVKPRSAFFLFLSEQSQSLHTNGKELVKNCKDQWTNLPNEQKDKYVKKAAQLMTEYMEELKKWENKMIAMGNTDVVKLKSIAEKKRSAKTAKQ